jgi:Tol biopolymer transport system component
MLKLFLTIIICVAALLSSRPSISPSAFYKPIQAIQEKVGGPAPGWEPDRRLTRSQATSQTSINFARSIAADDAGRVYLVWKEPVGGNTEIYYKRSPDGGISWGPAVRLSSAVGVPEAGNPGIAASGNSVHVVWFDMRTGMPQIYYKRSDDGGLTWSADAQISDSPVHAAYPSIAVQGNSVYVVHGDLRDGSPQVYYLRSLDSGVTWSTPVRLSASMPHNSYTPTVAVSNSNVYVAWTDTRDFAQPSTLEEEYLRRSTDGGATFEPEQRLTTDPLQSPANSWAPSLAARDQNVWITWFDARDGNFEIYTRRSLDGGASWSANTRLTTTSGQSQRPVISQRGEQLYIVYWETTASGEEVYILQSNDLGTSWLAPEQLSFSGFGASYPSIDVSTTGVHVAWTDARDQNAEVYYKRLPGKGVRVGNGRIAFTRLVNGELHIFTVASDGTDDRQLTFVGRNEYPAWSKDGTKLAFTSTRSGAPEIWTMNPDGSDQRQITHRMPGGSFTPDWSYDGTRIAYSFADFSGNGTPEVWVMNADGTQQTRLTTTKPSGGQFIWSLHPSWDPGDTRIYYASTASGSSQIWGMLADGNGKHQKTNGLGPGYPDANVPEFSRDGSRVVFWSGIEAQYGEVWTMDPSGVGFVRVTETADPQNSDNPTWSPDGTRLLFDSNRPSPGGGVNIWSVGIDGSNQVLLIPGANGQTSWQPVFNTTANISGRLTTRNGRGVHPSAVVTLTDNLGNVRYASTNTFGYYRFSGIATGQSYTITVRAKRYTFPSRTISVWGDLTNVDFTAEP